MSARQKSVVPTPEVLSSVRLDEAVVPPIMSGVVADVVKVGVVTVGEALTTKVVPVPVCAVIDVTLPEELIGPVKFAFVVTVPAVKPAAVPVAFVRTAADGVPKLGVVKAQLVVRHTLPVPLTEYSPTTPALSNNTRVVVPPLTVVEPIVIAELPPPPPG